MKSIIIIFLFAMAFILACNSTPTQQTPDLDSLQTVKKELDGKSSVNKAVEEAKCKSKISKQVLSFTGAQEFLVSKGRGGMYDTLTNLLVNSTCDSCQTYWDYMLEVADK